MNDNQIRELALVAIYSYLIEDFERREDREKILTPEFASSEVKLDDFEKYKEIINDFQENGLIKGVKFIANGKVMFEDGLISVTLQGENEAVKILKKYT